MIKLSIVIVNYNGGDHLLKCLESLEAIKQEVDLKVWVVDNASQDDSLKSVKDKFPQISYIENAENLGFGRANNQALRQIDDGYILILNPDTVLDVGVLPVLLQYMESHQDVGAATCKIVFENGDIDLTAHRGFPTPWASLLYLLGNDSLYHLSGRDMNSIHEVDAITGAFFLTRAEVLKKVGLFDEDYFMYAEDIDLCYRIKKEGYKIVYIPTVSILHVKGISSGLKKQSQHLTTADKATRLRSLNYFYITMKIFYRKHYQSKYPFFVNWLVYLGINLRWWQARRKLIV